MRVLATDVKIIVPLRRNYTGEIVHEALVRELPIRKLSEVINLLGGLEIVVSPDGLAEAQSFLGERTEIGALAFIFGEDRSGAEPVKCIIACVAF